MVDPVLLHEILRTLALAAAMRTKQTEYFNTRNPKLLGRCKHFERRFDEALVRIADALDHFCVATPDLECLEGERRDHIEKPRTASLYDGASGGSGPHSEKR